MYSSAFNYIETLDMYSSTTQTFKASTTAIACQVTPDLSDLFEAPFVVALEAVPAEDWCRTWPAERTIMLRKTSKRVRKAVDKMRPPAVVRLCRNFWYNFNAKPEFVMIQLLSLVTNCKITTLKLERCNIDWEIQQLKKVLDQCPELTKLDLSGNNFSHGSFVDALIQWEISPQTNFAVCGLISLNLESCDIGNYAVARFANALRLNKFSELSCLNLKYNFIDDTGAKILAGMLGQCKALTSLNLGYNEICYGAINIAENLSQCSTLTELDLSCNYIDCESAMYIAKNLPECDALAHLDLSSNLILRAGSIARVLGQCTSLTYLNLKNNKMSESTADYTSSLLHIRS